HSMSIHHDPPFAPVTSPDRAGNRDETGRDLPVTARVRATEGIGPRPSELIADRLFAVAALAQLTRPQHAAPPSEPSPIDAEALSKLATEQQRDEEELIEQWD